jgi:hypothetical protein
MEKCRWCGLDHGPICSTVKALEYFEDGVTVKRVEFKSAADYMAPMLPAPWPQSNQPPFVPTWNIVGTNPDGTPRYVDMRAHGG